MTKTLTFLPEQMFEQLRLSAQVPALTEKIIARQIIERAAKEANIVVESEELQQAVDSWRLVNQLDSVEATQAWLNKHYLSLDELGELISNTVIATKLAQHLFSRKVESYFADYQIDYMQADMYEIVLDDEDIGMELCYAIDEGEISFFEAAYQYIQDRELSRKGGYKGTIYHKDLKPEISAAVFAAEPPQILRPITTSSGVHIIRVEQLVKPRLDNGMRQKIVSELFDSWLVQQIRKFELKIDFKANRRHISEIVSQQPAAV